LTLGIQNLQKCVHFFEKHEPTLKAHRKEWAAAHLELGNAYTELPRGNKTENTNKASHHYHVAQDHFTREDQPDKWALIQYGMGRVHASDAAQQESAFYYYEMALEVQTRKTSPLEWARTHFALGELYLRRTRGDLRGNIDGCLTHGKKALKILNEREHAPLWAGVHHSMSIAYAAEHNQSRGVDTSQQQLEHLQLALRVFTKEEPYYKALWARLQMQLGHVYFQRSDWMGEAGVNEYECITAYEEAIAAQEEEGAKAGPAGAVRLLTVQEEVHVRVNMAASYTSKAEQGVAAQQSAGNNAAGAGGLMGGHLQEWAASVTCLQQALKLLPMAEQPYVFAQLAAWLGDVLAQAGDSHLSSAQDAYLLAMQAVGILANLGATGKEGRPLLVDHDQGFPQLVERSVEVCVRLYELERRQQQAVVAQQLRRETARKAGRQARKGKGRKGSAQGKENRRAQRVLPGEEEADEGGGEDAGEEDDEPSPCFVGGGVGLMSKGAFDPSFNWDLPPAVGCRIPGLKDTLSDKKIATNGGGGGGHGHKGVLRALGVVSMMGGGGGGGVGGASFAHARAAGGGSGGKSGGGVGKGCSWHLLRAIELLTMQSSVELLQDVGLTPAQRLLPVAESALGVLRKKRREVMQRRASELEADGAEEATERAARLAARNEKAEMKRRNSRQQQPNEPVLNPYAKKAKGSGGGGDASKGGLDSRALNAAGNGRRGSGGEAAALMMSEDEHSGLVRELIVLDDGVGVIRDAGAGVAGATGIRAPAVWAQRSLQLLPHSIRAKVKEGSAGLAASAALHSAAADASCVDGSSSSAKTKKKKKAEAFDGGNGQRRGSGSSTQRKKQKASGNRPPPWHQQPTLRYVEDDTETSGSIVQVAAAASAAAMAPVTGGGGYSAGGTGSAGTGPGTGAGAGASALAAALLGRDCSWGRGDGYAQNVRTVAEIGAALHAHHSADAFGATGVDLSSSYPKGEAAPGHGQGHNSAMTGVWQSAAAKSSDLEKGMAMERLTVLGTEGNHPHHHYHPSTVAYSLTHYARPMAPATLAASAGEKSAVVVWRLTARHIYAFVVRNGDSAALGSQSKGTRLAAAASAGKSMIKVWRSSSEDRLAIGRWIDDFNSGSGAGASNAYGTGQASGYGAGVDGGGYRASLSEFQLRPMLARLAALLHIERVLQLLVPSIGGALGGAASASVDAASELHVTMVLDPMLRGVPLHALPLPDATARQVLLARGGDDADEDDEDEQGEGRKANTAPTETPYVPLAALFGGGMSYAASAQLLALGAANNDRSGATFLPSLKLCAFQIPDASDRASGALPTAADSCVDGFELGIAKGMWPSYEAGVTGAGADVCRFLQGAEATKSSFMGLAGAAGAVGSDNAAAAAAAVGASGESTISRESGTRLSLGGRRSSTTNATTLSSAAAIHISCPTIGDRALLLAPATARASGAHSFANQANNDRFAAMGGYGAGVCGSVNYAAASANSSSSSSSVVCSRELLESLELHSCRLAILSRSDEWAGRFLPRHQNMITALHCAGAASVVHTLWPVPAVVSALVLGLFYALLGEMTLEGETRPVVAALREAQLQVMSMDLKGAKDTLHELRQMCNGEDDEDEDEGGEGDEGAAGVLEAEAQLTVPKDMVQSMERALEAREAVVRSGLSWQEQQVYDSEAGGGGGKRKGLLLFDSPSYWAAFVVEGGGGAVFKPGEGRADAEERERREKTERRQAKTERRKAKGGVSRLGRRMGRKGAGAKKVVAVEADEDVPEEEGGEGPESVEQESQPEGGGEVGGGEGEEAEDEAEGASGKKKGCIVM
jgi:hypothetical protein